MGLKLQKRFVSIALAALMLVSLACPAFAYRAVLSPQNLMVDGQNIECEKYNIDGSNYFKLRDIAYLMNGTGSQFSVGFSDGVVSINTGTGYEANGSELVVGKDKASTAQPSAQTIMINGQKRNDLSVYNIGGNNFFKLRDLGESLGFQVDYDAATATAIVVSGESTVDARQNQAMRNQMGNFYSSGCAVEAKDAVYYIAKRYVEDENGDYKLNGTDKKFSTISSIVKRYDDGKTQEIYYTSDQLDKISIDEDGNLYFVQGYNGEKIVKHNPVNGEITTVYVCENGWNCETYLLYDEKLIVGLQKISIGSSVTWSYKIESADGVNKRTLLSESGSNIQYLDTSLYAYDGKVFFLFNFPKSAKHYTYSLYAVDLNNGKRELVLNGEDSENLFLQEIAYCNDSFWFLGADENEENWVIKKSSLYNLGETIQIAEIPVEGQKLYTNLYANGQTLYYQCSSAAQLWQVSPNGEFIPIARASSPYHESSVVTRQGTIMLGIPRVMNLYNGQIEVLKPNGEETNYLNFLGYPDLEKELY